MKYFMLFTALVLLGCAGSIAPSNSTQELPDNKRCVATDTGWECIIAATDDPVYRDQEAAQQIEQQLREACENAGGRWICYGFCLPNYTQYCDFPSEDAGQKCADSSECRYACITADGDCTTDCKGACRAFPLRQCDYLANEAEVVGGTVLERPLIACD